LLERSDLRNKPSPPNASTKMTIRSNADMRCMEKCMLEMTPNIKETTDPTVIIQPR